jgi:hypothetical protein
MNKLTIKLSTRQRQEAYGLLLQHYCQLMQEPEDLSDALVYSVLREMYARMCRKFQCNNQKVTLHLEATERIALEYCARNLACPAGQLEAIIAREIALENGRSFTQF